MILACIGMHVIFRNVIISHVIYRKGTLSLIKGWLANDEANKIDMLKAVC